MRAAALILFVLSIFSGEIVDVGIVTETEGIAIRACHEGDRSMIEVVPSNPGPTRRGGFFTTTNSLLTMAEPAMTMVPTGTNVLKIQTVCQGSTSEVREVQFVIRRLLPAPKVSRGRKMAVVTDFPPLPPGLVLPLPGGHSDASYGDYLKRLKQAETEGRRRSE